MKYAQLKAEIEDIRRRYDLADVIPATARRQKARDGYMDLCFVHADIRPSLHIVCDNPTPPHHQFYYCFGCGTHGDLFSYVRWRDGIGFREAVDVLAHRMSVPPKQRLSIPVPMKLDSAIYTRKDLEPFLRSMTDADFKWFEEHLHVPQSLVQAESIGTVGNNVYTFPSFDAYERDVVRAIMHYDPLHRTGKPKWIHHNRDPKKIEHGYIYRANEIVGKRSPLLVEGGKDCLRAVAEGYDAASLTNGALSWQPGYAEFFSEANEVFVWLDWDEPKKDPRSGCEVGQAGQRGTQRICQSMRRAIPVDWNVAKEMFGLELYSGIDPFDFLDLFDPWDAEALLAECRRRYA